MKTCAPRGFRPNTRKIYEDHYQVCVLPGFEVHHVLPTRLGGSHGPENLVPVTRDEHVQAHLDLWVEHGDTRDLCAAYMISGRSKEAHLIACSMGGKRSQEIKRERGDLNGFQLFDKDKRAHIARIAGRKGGMTQVAKRLGIHTDDAELRSEWARMGALAVRDVFSESERQASRGRRGGVKNSGAKWYLDADQKPQKYTAKMQEAESFDAFIARTGFTPGRGKSNLKGSRFYNNGERQWMFDPAKHEVSFENFLKQYGYYEGRLK